MGAALLLPAVLGCSEGTSGITSSPRHSQASDSSFAVGASAVLEVSNFAGTTRVRPGNAGVMGVTATRWAGRTDHLSEIEIEMESESDTVRIRTTNPASLSGVSVDLDVTVPAGTRATLGTGAGSLFYEGRPIGESIFSVGAGDITLRMPADVNVEVLLTVGTGTIVLDFPVTGQVGMRLVDGVIGTGADGRVVATVGAGNIFVRK
jgi:hypothetical protein